MINHVIDHALAIIEYTLDSIETIIEMISAIFFNMENEED